jgi:CelD/BcsL family acetyltransferase involved in cellulose biosynthesis/glycosyltransferase involved in cell wall biosynthesis
MTLTVLQVAYPLAPVGEDAVGGAEQVLTTLDEALTARGVRSLVLACEGSTSAGALLRCPRWGGRLDDTTLAQAQGTFRERLQTILREEAVDIVHLHGVDFEAYLPAAHPGVLATLHLPPSYYRPGVFARGDVHLCAVSRQQWESCPGRERIDLVPNGIQVDRFRFSADKGDFVLALGRICREKGYHRALAAARRAGVRMKLAGEVFDYPEHRRYFAERIRPLLDGERTFVGPAGFAHKQTLLAEARCLLVPSLVPETSSLVAMEALACGTPVVAFRAGALASLIEPGRTGFLVDDTEGMAEAIARAHEIDPAECRRAAEARFGAAAMVDGYVRLYERLAERRGRSSARGRRVEEPRVERLETLAEAEALGPEWRALWRRCPQASVFQHPGWLLPWARQFAGPRLHVVCVRRGGALVAVAPFYVRGGAEPGAGPATVRAIGCALSDEWDLLAAPGEAPPAAALVRAALADAGGAETIVGELPRDAQLLAGVARDAPAGELVEAGITFTLALDPGRPLAENLPRDMVARLQYARRRAGRRGGLSVERVNAPAALRSALDRLFSLHAARWQRRGEPGVLSDPRVRRFHEEAAAALLDEGLLRLFVVRIGDRVVAAHYGFQANGRASYYVGGFDPEAGAASPGVLAVGHAIEEALREGCTRFEFLRGDEPYKQRWGAVAHPLFAWRLRGAPDTASASVEAEAQAAALG